MSNLITLERLNPKFCLFEMIVEFLKINIDPLFNINIVYLLLSSNFEIDLIAPMNGYLSLLFS